MGIFPEVLKSKKKKGAEGHYSRKMNTKKKEQIIKKLRESGCRITKQRRILLDIILEDECTCCKEIYYKALKKDDTIGMATVYRMISTLEEIGVINRQNFYRIVEDGEADN